MAFLNRSPVLETLVFLEVSGIILSLIKPNGWNAVVNCLFNGDSRFLFPTLQGLSRYYLPPFSGYEQLESELEAFRALHEIPSCCRYHLKRIEIKSYFGLQREIEIIGFLLRHALVLEELVIYRAVKPPLCVGPDEFDKPFVAPVADVMSTQSTLNNLPRASLTCLILVL